jgi:hypothetical protein
MRKFLLLTFFTHTILFSFAGNISGLVTDDKGTPLPYASVSIKGTTRGTTANGSGRYTLSLNPGDYTIVCQYVGYSKVEKRITATGADMVVDFTLSIQQLTLGEVVVKKGEDPAYEIIRQAIKKRDYYNTQVDSFSVEVYIKGLMRSRNMPQRFFGQKVERDPNDGLDSAGRGILFLSESVTKVSFKKPDKVKYEVVSTRSSGGGLGFSLPFFINFYQNNVAVFDNALNKRGFVSPISDGAMNYYRFKYEGSFVEDGKMVNTIKVIPRRKSEPLFSGVIQIIEDDWRIYSVDLLTTKEYQLELIDSLRISQIHSPITQDIWRTKNQVVYVAAQQFGFDFTGNFVNVYNDYNLAPAFTRKYFNRTIMKYDTGYNKKDTNYWNNSRPVALEQDEKRDFIFKDSLVRASRPDSIRSRQMLDSMRRARQKVTIKNILWSGVQHSFYNKRRNSYYRMQPLLKKLQYNTVEGISPHINQTLTLYPGKKYSLTLGWNMQYGFSNRHFNSDGSITIQTRKRFPLQQVLHLSGGKRLTQFNKQEPIGPLANAVYTLLGKKNYMKLYENWFGNISFYNRYDNGLSWKLHATWEDRLPVSNSTDFSFFNKEGTLLPNHPYELEEIPFTRHQALEAGFSIRLQPGQRYIEFPDSKIPMGSKYPTFELEYTKGISKLLGSDVDFDKWKFSVFDNLNLKLRGELRYKLSIGGFLNRDRVEIPDMQHFNGNRTIFNRRYVNSFQLAPYYEYSNTEKIYGLLHLEHHFNGLLSNKIPLFRQMKWYFVAGANMFYVNKNNYYVEAFAGVENIFKLFRVDFINAYQPGLGNQFGVRIGLGGLLGGLVKGINLDDNTLQIGGN